MTQENQPITPDSLAEMVAEVSELYPDMETSAAIDLATELLGSGENRS